MARRFGRWWRRTSAARFWRRTAGRALARASDRMAARVAAVRAHRHSAVPPPRKKLGRWRRRRWKTIQRPVALVFVPLMCLVLAGAVFLTVGAVIEFANEDSGLFGLDSRCSRAGASCGVLSSSALSLIPISIAVVWIFVVRLDRVRSRYRKYAWTRPDRLLETEIPSAKIVGRDDLCDVLQQDLETRWEDRDETGAAVHRRFRRRSKLMRRPVVLVGGVGVGKTAVMSRLTEILAERGAVPVPVRLRGVQDASLDILELARQKFLATAPVLSEAEGDKIWRRLRDNDQIVVVADGLEEALMTVTDTRETSLRAAFEKVRRQGVALIVSSRPHDALLHLDAAMVTLEPLEPRAALEYITGDADEDENSRAGLLVRHGELAELPLLMHVARELHLAGRLESVDTRDVGRLGLRVRMLERWIEVLEEGRIQAAPPVKPQRRQEVVEALEDFAAVALTRDSLELTFANLYDPAKGKNEEEEDAHDPYKATLDATTERLRAVVADGERLGLVEARPDGLRFRHSVTQAYLGSRAISRALTRAGSDGDARDGLFELLESGMKRPGRELLMALAMSCVNCPEPARTRAIRLLLCSVKESGSKAVNTASAVIAAASASTERTRSAGPAEPAWRGSTAYHRGDLRAEVVLRLKRAESEDAEHAAAVARQRKDDVLKTAKRATDEARRAAAHATELRAAAEARRQEADAARSAAAPDPVPVPAPAVGPVALAEAAAEHAAADADAAADAESAARRRADDQNGALAEAFADLALAKQLVAQAREEQARSEPDEPVRERCLEEAERARREAGEAEVEAIGAGVEAARRSLDGEPLRRRIVVPLKETTHEHDTQADDGVQAAKLDAVSRLSEAAQYGWLWEICQHERDYLVRLSATLELGNGGSVAFALIESDLRKIAESAGPRTYATERGVELLGWLLPLLYTSVERDAAAAARLRGETNADAGDPDVPPLDGARHRDLLESWVRKICDGVSLTGEMALAQGFRYAANRKNLPSAHRGVLSARAEDLLDATSFWFSQVALVQALTLWMLTDTEGRNSGRGGARDAEAKIYNWCDERRHPFVTEAVDLCARALRRRQPANYIWRDEGLATAKLGAGPLAVRAASSRDRWIPRSAGWYSLAPRAQRLLGDVVVLLNLADRGDSLEREEYLRRTHEDSLPPCLSARAGRARLDVGRKLDEQLQPSARCVAGCKVRLCPYPGLGDDTSRGELSETFCRTQHELVSAGRAFARPEWQKGASPHELRAFWREMERRPRA